ncbi:MAG: hypothetical protein HY023_16405 [Chloroflexi bacterium]|nr:hypothetical protein [Chloroflexota bacterium]MBI3764133.1 hypothetical protein [Chloroflexota bacterium]
MLSPSIFAPTFANFLTVLAAVAALAVGWMILRFILKLTRIIFTVGCLSLLAVTIALALIAFIGKGS